MLLPLLLMAAAALAGQDTRGTGEIADLERIMEVKVSSVQRREQRLGRSAAAVYVITQEDIRRSGVTSIVEALRLAPGMHVARVDSRRWAVSARGFTGEAANKLLVLIDGRSVYTPLYSGVFWDTQDTLLEDIDRIEVFRGPAATLWGANAVNGVINIVTKPARKTQGNLLAISLGGADRSVNRFRHGGQIGERLSYRVYGQYQRRSPLTPLEGGIGDPWGILQGGFRADWDRSERDAITLQGDWMSSDGGIEVNRASFEQPFNQALRYSTRASGGNLLGRWRRQFRNGSELTLQSYVDRTDREDLITFATNVVDAELLYSLPLKDRFRLTWGGGYRQVWDSTRMAPWGAYFHPAAATYGMAHLTLQGEAEVIPEKVSLTLGGRVEHNDLGKSNLQPSVRLLWSPSRKQAVWGAFSSATRTPSRVDRDWDALFAFPAPQDPRIQILQTVVGNPAFGNESLYAHEMGYRWQPVQRLSFDAAAFFNSYHDLQSRDLVSPPHPFDARYPWALTAGASSGNDLGATSRGFEASAEVQVNRRWRLKPVYSNLWTTLRRQQTGQSVSDSEANGTAGLTPTHLYQLHSYCDVSRRWLLDAHLYGSSRLPGSDYYSYLRTDLRLGWRVVELGEVTLGIQNLFNRRNLEYRSQLGTPAFFLKRTAYVGLSWRF